MCRSLIPVDTVEDYYAILLKVSTNNIPSELWSLGSSWGVRQLSKYRKKRMDVEKENLIWNVDPQNKIMVYRENQSHREKLVNPQQTVEFTMLNWKQQSALKILK